MKMSTDFLLLLTYLTLLCIKLAKCEVFTALADLEDVLKTEGVVLEALKAHIKYEENRLDSLKKLLNMYREQQENIRRDPERYVTNPINGFLLIKRLIVDWYKVESLINTTINEDTLSHLDLIKANMKFPTQEDLRGAAAALTRLQDTYHLDASALAKGEINGVKYADELTSVDCFTLGILAYANRDYRHAKVWLHEADSRLQDEIKAGLVTENEILEHLAFSAFQEGNIHLALKYTNRLLEIQPGHERAVRNKRYYEYEIQQFPGKNDIPARGEGEEGRDKSHFPTEDELDGRDADDGDRDEIYEPLCRGDVSLSPDMLSSLKCRYVSRDDPFLRIGPFKVEEAHLEPDIFIFHDVLGDSEIETIKSFALPRLHRAETVDDKTGSNTTGDYRISKVAWIEDFEHKHIADVSQRVTDMTGLTMETAEHLQVVNYGIGGHYEPHYDFAPKETAAKATGVINRIATVLFYMSDVAEGGATVFPFIDVTLRPKKGSAAFWYNLHPSGDGDKYTQHAACPVLVGSKWGFYLGLYPNDPIPVTPEGPRICC